MSVVRLGGSIRQLLQGISDRALIPARADLLQSSHLRFPHRRVVHFKQFHFGFIFRHKGIHADDVVLAGVDAGLAFRGGFFDAHLRKARFDGLAHAAEFFHFLDPCPCFVYQFICETFEVVAATERINELCDAAVFLQVELRVAGDLGTEIGG